MKLGRAATGTCGGKFTLRGGGAERGELDQFFYLGKTERMVLR